MSAVARVTVLHLRTVAPYRTQGLLGFGLMALVLARNPDHVIPALAVLLAPLVAVHPFAVADKEGLETLYDVLPLPRRAVLLGTYVWALASFVVTVAAGAVLAVLLSRVEGVQLGGRTAVTMLTLAWALFAVNIALQFPLLIRFGHARVSVLATTMPLALVMLAVYRLHLSVRSVHAWLPLVWVAGAAALVTSAVLAAHAPMPRARPGAGPSSGSPASPPTAPGSFPTSTSSHRGSLAGWLRRSRDVQPRRRRSDSRSAR